MSIAERPHPSLARCVIAGLTLLLAATGVGSAQAAVLPAGFTETRIATGLASPTAMAIAPDGRIFVCEQSGRLRVIRNGTLLSTPFLTVTVSSVGERGLLGVAFDPDFASNRFVYVYYTATSPSIHNRVSRFTASATNPDVAVAGSEVQLLNLPNLSSATNHNGGALHFGPDGMLYIVVGENANPNLAPSLNSPLGKILRINKNGTIPSDNPFFNQTTGINQAIWARGLRNPFTFAFHRTNGRMHVNDVGQNTWEEVNLGVAGSNYGWPATEGPEPPGMAGVRYPIHSYANAGSNCAIVGAAFYDPPVSNFPATFANRYFFGDFCGGFIRTLSPPGYTTASGFATGISSLVDIAVGQDGFLYYLTRGDGGSVFRVVFSDNAAPEITAHPQSVTVAVGQPATFSVSASGATPLQFQWQRNGGNIPGATGSSFTVASPTLADDGDTFRAVVSNAFGTATSNSATLTVTGNSPPVGTITTPANGTLFSGGQTFNFAGSASDPEDGPLPASAFTWRVDLHHESHTHPFVPSTSGITSGSFRTSDRGHPETTTFYRITLTVRDSGGLTHTTSVDLRPRTSTITLASQPTGLQVTLDGQPRTTPFSEGSVEGVFRTLGVVSPQTSGGTTFEFVSWSDGGAATHEIVTPVNNTTFTATFQAVAGNTVFFDDFEADRGWVRNPSGTDTATTGLWERGDPEATTSGGVNLQLGNANSGTNALVTARLAGGSAGANDVDGGVTSIQSTAINLPSGTGLTLSFAYYFAHLNNATNADFLRVRVVGSTTTTVLNVLGAGVNRAGAWATQTADISGHAGQTVRIVIDTADAATGSLIEAGIDDVRIERGQQPPPPPPGDVFFDDFESDRGWTANPGGADTATTGQWVRGDPAQTASGGSVMQLGTTNSGVNALVTGTAGGGVGDADVDGGVTSILSPPISLPSSGTLTLSFAFYMAHLNNASNADFFRVSLVVGSTPTPVFEELGSADTDVAAWVTQSVSVSNFAGQTVRILIQAADAAGGSLVEAAVDDVRIQAGGSAAVVFRDDFEASLGWIPNPGGSDSAATGQWERGDPEQTASGASVMQLGTSHGGSNNLVTGAVAGTSVGTADVDGGVTSIASPPIDLPSDGTLTLSFAYYLAHLDNASSEDFLRVSVVGDTTSVVLEEQGSGEIDVAAWETATADISDFAGETIQMLIEAADAGDPSLVEAAVDDVEITQQE